MEIMKPELSLGAYEWGSLGAPSEREAQIGSLQWAIFLWLPFKTTKESTPSKQAQMGRNSADASSCNCQCLMSTPAGMLRHIDAGVCAIFLDDKLAGS